MHRVKEFKNGNRLTAYHQTGSIVSKNPKCPWSEATFFPQGSVLEDSNQVIIAEVALCETVDSDGDLTWSTFWRSADGSSEIAIKAGTGKWKGITGYDVTRAMLRDRADDHYMLKSEMHWNIKKN